MANKLVSLHWDPDRQFILQDKDAFQVVMKKPKGVSASDLLPMSLIGCASHDVVEILNKQKQDLRELKVTAESTQDEDPPWRFRKIHIHYQVIGKEIDPEKVRKAILLSEEKYCSVYATLKDVLEITHDFEIVEG
ncbi:MAG: OsmC family protein [Anaerolineales bacterium]|nr:OsmC family protein [Anaerolineales bacterium]